MNVILPANLSLTKFLQLFWRIITWRYNKQCRCIFINLFGSNCRKCLRWTTDTWYRQFLSYISVKSILQFFRFKHHDNKDLLERCKFFTCGRKLLFRFFTLIPCLKLTIIKVYLFGQFREVKTKRVEHFLSIKGWPWWQNDFIFKWRRNQSCKEFPLLSRNLLWEDSLD